MKVINKIKLLSIWLASGMVLLVITMALAACGDNQAEGHLNSQPAALPTVTPLIESSSDSWAVITPVPVPASAIAGQQPAQNPFQPPEQIAASNRAAQPAANVPAQGTFVEIENVIQQLQPGPAGGVIIIVQNKPYLLEAYMVRILGSRTTVGAHIKFTARYNEAGQAVITKVVWINPPINAVPVNPVSTSSDKGNNKGNDKGKDNSKDNGENKGDD